MSNNSKKLGDELRSLLQDSKEESDISAVWDDQKRMRDEDKKLEAELKASKQRAREIKKQLRDNYLDDASKSVLETVQQTLGRGTQFSNSIVGKIKSGLFYSTATIGHFINNRRKTAAGILVLTAVVIIISFRASSNNSNQTATLGDSTKVNSSSQVELPREKPNFDLVFPNGGKEEDYDVVRISPDTAAPSYAYLDRFESNGPIFRVTQQEIPTGFDLASVASDFQATNIIQVDNNKLYHGYAEKSGVQSLLFITDNKLIFIRSPQKFSDDMWASYYLSLN